MTPNYLRSAMWESVATTPDKDHVTAAVNDFKKSHAPAKLLLTACYDGVDLPGDTCRIMIIDDLPSATGPLERFMWEYLRMSKTLRTTIASRIVQSFGRISRRMSDYGIVFLTGESLVKWLSTPQNQMALPQFLQKQLLLGYQISENINPAEIGNTIDRCLDRDESWISAYENFMDTAVPLAGTRNTSIETELAISEAKFASAMWRRDFVSAAAILTGTLESAQQLSASTQAWHLFWIAAATEIAGDTVTANQLYRRAHGTQINLPAPEPNYEHGTAGIVSSQAKQAALQFVITNTGIVECPARMDQSLASLISGGTPGQIEEAIRNLGILLGLCSTRPDNEEGTGPDNLWIYGDTALCFDAKTDKLPTSLYRKSDEIGQMADHKQWVLDNTDVNDIIPIFVGPEVPASNESNPPADLLVITQEKLGELAGRLCACHRDIAASSIPLNLAPRISDEFATRRLKFSELLESLSPVRLIDIRHA